MFTGNCKADDAFTPDQQYIDHFTHGHHQSFVLSLNLQKRRKKEKKCNAIVVGFS